MVLQFYAPSIVGGGGGIVALVLAEKQIPFNHVLIDIHAQDHKTSEFLAMNPFGQDDDGFVLYESRAICRYLCEKYADLGTPLLPSEVTKRAIFEQAASVESANFTPTAKAARDAARKQAMADTAHGRHQGKAALDAALSDLSATLDVYEVILGKYKFIAGDKFTLADVFHYSYAPYLAESRVDIMTSRGPNVARWWNELMSRPAWVKLKREGM
ncbi:glutathione S-transferase [Mycena pura]|uniref:glutathione transferase n=1 Tax=Mycena pura TaxID=153505 RepID=A0AAD6VV38_9AGAR|nr:glutathione S-transferase [Mycena pura]